MLRERQVKWWMTAVVSTKGQQREEEPLTNFPSAVGVTVHEHATAAILRHWPTGPPHELAREGAARLDGLHGKQLSHRIWDVI